MDVHNKKYYFFIDAIKVIAILLILNSHMDSLYPNPKIATGGALGNSLFFIVSGYLIKDKNKTISSFVKFTLKIYIPAWIAIMISGLSSKPLISQLLWPTNYWFVGAIILFYLLIYLLERTELIHNFYLIVTLLSLLYFVIYLVYLDTSTWVVETSGLDSLEGCFKLIYYFVIMLYGYKIKGDGIKFKNHCFIKMILSVLIMYASKAIMDRYSFFMHFQFISQLMPIIFSCNFLKCAMNSKTLNNLGENEYISRIIKLISSCSLEFYLVQFKVIDYAERFLFPANILITVILTFLCGYLLWVISNWLFKKINSMNSSVE